jgi:hypothetical protein
MKAMSVSSEQFYANWRDQKGLSQCIRCGKKLSNEPHHFYCNVCWLWDKLNKIGRNIDNEFRRVRNMEVISMVDAKNEITYRGLDWDEFNEWIQENKIELVTLTATNTSKQLVDAGTGMFRIDMDEFIKGKERAGIDVKSSVSSEQIAREMHENRSRSDS